MSKMIFIISQRSTSKKPAVLFEIVTQGTDRPAQETVSETLRDLACSLHDVEVKVHPNALLFKGLVDDRSFSH